MRDGQHAKAPFDTGEQRSIKSKVYSGNVFAVKAQVAPAGSGGNIGGLIFLIDLPLSIVADTLILPYTGYYELSKSEPVKNLVSSLKCNKSSYSLKHSSGVL